MFDVVSSLGTGTGGTTDTSSISLDLVYSRLTSMDSDLSSLMDGMDEVNTTTTGVSADIGALIENINRTRGTALNAQTIGSIVDSVGAAIGGTGQDDLSSILSRLMGIEGKLGEIGVDAARAASLTQGSMAQSNLIQSIVEHIKGLLEEGKLEEAEEELMGLADKLLELKEGVDGVPGAITADSLSESARSSLDELNRLAMEKGIDGLIPPIEFPEDGAPVKDEDVIEIRNGVSELKSLMVEVRGLLDQEINKPIIHGWLESEE
jgi:hypothetical protein